ncbi:GNAT family N-acetyltransferase [Henriciella aquimarina]|uniref:GNAT family N-acetyltransferase n=1 Tax=Henriciella aquimarina TaxID=545261 RepID=UPI000A06D98D|nr:GNAT family N-acetyltransferase [Henriciella aquimarina]
MLDIHLPETIRPATRADWRQLGDITAEAFAQDPFNLWIFGRARALKPLFRTMARDIYLKTGFCHLAEDSAATMWAMHDAKQDFPPLSLARLIATQMVLARRGAMKRALAAADTMQAHHPKDPHVYLFTVGTRAAARGKGLGKAMLAPVLTAADRKGLPAYLENTNPANDGFYRSLGFERHGDFRVDETAPLVTTMWREPQPG